MSIGPQRVELRGAVLRPTEGMFGMRVLCTGDIHIGRRSSRIAGSYRSADMWTAIVDLAITERVDVLAISGDVIDKENASYEALGPLQHGLGRLNSAGIDTVAVTGNHDDDVLARLAGTTGTERFHLLGIGGRWERVTLSKERRPVLHVHGWSFPREHVMEAPLQSYVPASDDGVPVLGLLHGEVDVSGSRYAPIDQTALWSHNVYAWLLGHIHAPRRYDGPRGRIAFYPGSPLALDPGESGTHGVWMLEIGRDRVPAIRQIPLSPVRYDSMDVDASRIVDESDLQRVLNDALISLGRRTAEAHGSGTLEVVSARLRLTGRSTAHALIPVWIERAVDSLGGYRVEDVSIEIDRITSDVRPQIDLHGLALKSDPAGEVAKLILALDEPTPEPLYQALVRQTLDDLRSVYHHPTYATLRSAEERSDESSPEEADARALLVDRAWSVLSSLVAQREMA